MWKQPIPVHAARAIAEQYGWDQVIIVARKVTDASSEGGEHCTTYGRDKEHCSVAARIGDFLKFKVMGWVKEQTTEHRTPTREEVAAAEKALGFPPTT